VLKLGEVGVASVGMMDVSDIKFIKLVEEEVVDLRAADDEDLRVGGILKIVGGVDDRDSLMTPFVAMGEDDVFTFRERAPDGVESGAAHEDGMTEGCFFEEFEILRQVPGKVAVFSDDTIIGHGYDGGEFHD